MKFRIIASNEATWHPSPRPRQKGEAVSIPATPLQAITGNETLLVLAAHPGDESALCGGLIAQS